MHRHAVAVLRDASQLVDVGDVEAGVDALREQVHRERDQVDVACPLAVAEQAPLDPLGTGHDAELGRGDRRATIVVGMDAQDDGFAPRDLAAEVLDEVGEDVRGGHLHRRGQVEDDRCIARRLHRVHDCRADLERVVDLGPGE